MNTKIIKTVLAVAAFVMMAGYSVNAQRIAVKGDIPFDFIVGNELMKAGEYVLSQNNMPSHVMSVRGYETDQSVARIIMNIDHKTLPNETVLIFNRYVENGGEVSTFLSQVWVEGVKTGQQFLKTRAEREAAARAATRDIITLVVKRVDHSGQ